MEEEKRKEKGRLGNPALNYAKDAAVALSGEETATTKGAFEKLGLLLIGLFIATGVSCYLSISGGALFVLVILALGVGWYICLLPQFTAALAPLYVVLEGVLLGQIAINEEELHPGIPLQTLLVTFVIAVFVAAMYFFNWVEVNEVFKSRVFLATFGILVVYIVDLVLLLGFNIRIPMLHESNWKGILASLFIISVAAMNLAWDFEEVCKLSAKGLPKYFEWYFAFGLIVTLIWLYLEAMDLLRKITRFL